MPEPWSERRYSALHFALQLLFVVTLAAGAPVVEIDEVAAFPFHFLVFVRSNEDGIVHCGMLERTSGDTYTPSTNQLQTGSGLDAQASVNVIGAETTSLVLNGQPATAYDIFCYATGTLLIASSVIEERQQVTASGGDYTPPTFEYIPPYEFVESIQVRVFVRLSEDGRVWCVALKNDTSDGGPARPVPTSAHIQNNQDVDAWGTAEIHAMWNYENYIRLSGLVEDTDYDIYCFGVDMAGNGIDDTPAYVRDVHAIPNTKRSVRTLATLVATRLELHVEGEESVYYPAEPAAWNLLLPRGWTSSCAAVRSIESFSTPLLLQRATLTDHTSGSADVAHACESLPPAPRNQRLHVALVRRGKCSFSRKATIAQKAGFDGLLIVDSAIHSAQSIMPSMTTHNGDASRLTIPAWLIGRGQGEAISQKLALTQAWSISVDVEDRYRKPILGPSQWDVFGIRNYQTF